KLTPSTARTMPSSVAKCVWRFRTSRIAGMTRLGTLPSAPGQGGESWLPVFAGARLREWLAGAKIGAPVLRYSLMGSQDAKGSDFRKTRRTALYFAKASPGEDWGTLTARPPCRAHDDPALDRGASAVHATVGDPHRALPAHAMLEPGAIRSSRR